MPAVAGGMEISMAIENVYKIRTKGNNLFLRVAKGHFMKSNGHMNYYIEVVKQKSKLSEAMAVADELAIRSHKRKNGTCGRHGYGYIR